MNPQIRPARSVTSARIVWIYLAAGIAWILISDLLAHGTLYSISAVKGVAFVVTTGMLLLVLIRRLESEIERQTLTAAENAHRFQTLVETAPFGVFIQTGGRFRYMNPAACKMFGAPGASALLGSAVLDRFHPDFHPLILKRMETLRVQRQPVPPVDQRCLALDGRCFDAEVSAMPFEQDGESGTLVYLADISERLSRERLFREIAEAIPATVWIASDGGSILYLNKQWYAYTGHEPGDSSLANWIEAVHPDDAGRVRTAWNAAVASKSMYEVRLRYRRHDGEYRWYQARALPVSGSGGRVLNWFGISTDVDESSRLLGHLEAVAENERLRLSRELHDDLGQLLAAAKLHIELALRGSTDFQAKLEKARDDLVACMRRTRNMATVMRPAVLHHGGLVAALRAQAADFEASTRLPCPFSCDAGALQLPYNTALAVYRVIQEALTNVAKHAAATSVSLELRLAGSVLRASVTDNGCGFDTAGSPAGLGLIGMKERALSAGGVLTLDSGPGGTRVQIEVPLAPATLPGAPPTPVATP